MVNEMKNPSSLRIKTWFRYGRWKNKSKKQNILIIKHNALAQNVYDVGEALMALQEYEVIEIAKIDNTTLA